MSRRVEKLAAVLKRTYAMDAGFSSPASNWTAVAQAALEWMEKEGL